MGGVMRDPEFIELKNRFLIGLLVSLFIGVLLFLFYYRSYNFRDGDIYIQIKNSDKILVFVEDNDCIKCRDIKKALDDSKNKYIVYNRDEEDYKEELDLLLNLYLLNI